MGRPRPRIETQVEGREVTTRQHAAGPVLCAEGVEKRLGHPRVRAGDQARAGVPLWVCSSVQCVRTAAVGISQL